MSSGFKPEAAFASAAERFFDMMKSFSAQPGAAAGAAPDAATLASSLAGQFEQWLRATQSAGPWFSPAAGGAGNPAGIGAAFNPGGGPSPFGPLPLGMGAATAAEGQRSFELLSQLAQLQGQLAGHWHEIATSAATQFAARLGSLASGPPTLDAAMKAYELWVDCAESAYGTAVRKDGFARLQSQLANVSAALLVEQRKHAETLARAFGLPTRNEVDALYGQVRELRRELVALAQGRTGEPVHKEQERARAKPRSAKRASAARKKSGRGARAGGRRA
jgi:Poly(R)-hydroxyalkanoic acid synthase subunit (PHA_synth_III_E)